MSAQRIAALFLLFGAAWILTSDIALQWVVSDVVALSRLQSAKGLTFVACGGLFVYALVRIAERRQCGLERRLQDERDLLARILDAAPASLYALRQAPGEDGRRDLAFIGQTVEHLTGHGQDRWMSDPTLWRSSLHPDDLAGALAAHRQLETEDVVRCEYRLRHADGSYRWIHDSAVLKRDAHQQPADVVGVWLDVTARRQADQHAQLLARMFELSQEGVMITDERTRFLSVNRTFTRVTGYTEDEVRGRTPAVLKSGIQDATFYAAMWRELRRTGQWEGEVWNRRKNGEVYPEWLRISAIPNEQGRICQYLGVFTDISGRKAAEARIHRLSNYDALTGLPNRRLLSDRAQVAITAASPQRASLLLLHLNIDQFGTINESLGHAAGDHLLQELGRRLIAALEPEATVCRLGGDNFAVLVPGGAMGDIGPLGLRLMDAVATPLRLQDQTLRMSACIGVATFPDNGRNFAELMQAAEAAVHQAKREGRGLLRIASHELQARVQEELELANDLRGALERQELLLHYQPQFAIEDGRLTGCEALLRWQHPRLGLVPPGRFIPMAEESGLIADIGRWVIREAVRQCAVWKASGVAPVPVAVNLSVVQFRDARLCAEVSQTLRDHRMEPRLLELELTESIAVEDSDFTISTIAALKRIGVQLSIDDFGTGYSSLNYLRHFELDKLKIDRSFVHGLGSHERDDAIVSTIIALARNLGLRTIAEGVERPEQLWRLKALGCDEVQGYLTGRPMPAENLERVLRAGRAECHLGVREADADQESAAA